MVFPPPPALLSHPFILTRAECKKSKTFGRGKLCWKTGVPESHAGFGRRNATEATKKRESDVETSSFITAIFLVG